MEILKVEDIIKKVGKINNENRRKMEKLWKILM